MTLPFTLPEWLPWWVPIAVLVPLALYALALLAMPFAVLGVKSRLDAIELRLDEIQGEIRTLALRAPPQTLPDRRADEAYVDPPGLSARRPVPSPAQPMSDRPPIAPVRASGDHAPGASRAEPRLDWPRER